MRLLGLETSCDETAAAVVEAIHKNKTTNFKVLSNVVASQIKIHARTGGVVPEIAARAHLKKIIPVLQEALKGAGCKKTNPPIDAIAVTVGPGLITSLLVGVEAARTLSFVWQKPLIAVNHLEGHIAANWLKSPKEKNRNLISNSEFPFPILCLIVSGGHTELILMKKPLNYKIIGTTRDDAAGECLDKVAKILGLGYPGGPMIAKLAEEWKIKINKQKKRENSKLLAITYRPLFPRPMLNSPDYDFSFAGLKTAVLYFVKNQKYLNQELTEKICYEVQEAIVDVLITKTLAAAKKFQVKTVMIGGGVAANQSLRVRLQQKLKEDLPSVFCHLPSLEYTTDNAAMIATAGYFQALRKNFLPWQKIEAKPNLSLK